MNFIPQIKKYLQARHFNAVQPVAALIDMDGTLYDSMGNHASAWHRMVTELGIDMPRDEFFMYEGRTGAATLAEMPPTRKNQNFIIAKPFIFKNCPMSTPCQELNK